jgi:voltage-gated potassium channel
MALTTRMTRHVQLLTVLVASELVRPALARAGPITIIVSLGLFALIGVTVFRAVFNSTRRRRVGVSLIGLAIGINILGILVPGQWNNWIEVASNVATAGFFVFVLYVIVNHVFSAKDLRTDDVVGAFSGYIIIALIWGRLYTIAWRIVPDYFSISPSIAWQLANWNTRHALFDYYSFTNISSIGYGDITTTGPATNTLVWLEVMCGQFYLAVVVATIVGIKVSQALAQPRDGK